MRLAILSDIHGNLEAFKEVLADMAEANIDEAVCLGDNIGYGPEPDEVVKLLREQAIPSVMGNHELSLVDPEYLSWMNPSAQKSLILTAQLLSADTIEYLKTLPPAIPFHGSLCVHGCPPDSVTTYLFELSRKVLKELFLAMPEKVCFVGHTHDLEIFTFDGQKVKGAPLREGVVKLDQENQYLINIGSVGQPRDGNNNAKYVIWDNESGTLEVRFVPYDIATTAEKILKLGFPEFNADRLW
jgi:predicted phosphodiesterase